MSRWDGPFSSASISLAKEFSKNNLVFYVDNPFTVKDYISLKRLPAIKLREKALLFGTDIYQPIEKELKNLIGVTPKMVIPINWMPQGNIYEAFSSFNNRVIIEIIRKIKRDYQFEDYILFNSYNPFYGYDLPGKLKPVLSVYQSRDDISESPYVDKHGVRHEARALRKADFAFATSLGLVKKLKKFSDSIHYLPNAADISLFETNPSVEKPSEIQGLQKKIIGYTGNICHRIDYRLLKDIAVRHSDKVILMVGPRNDKKHSEVDLDTIPNIIFVGPKPIGVLSQYLQYMDCAIIPFQCNELTKSIYPLKINEYLAAGKPIVSTCFSEDVAGFKEVAYLAESNEEFLQLIDEAISKDNEELVQKRRAVAEENTWGARVKLFWDTINNPRA